MSQDYMYIINMDADIEAAKSVIEKLATRAGPGAIIPVTDAEFKVLGEMRIIPLGPPPPDGQTMPFPKPEGNA